MAEKSGLTTRNMLTCRMVRRLNDIACHSSLRAAPTTRFSLSVDGIRGQEGARFHEEALSHFMYDDSWLLILNHLVIEKPLPAVDTAAEIGGEMAEDASEEGVPEDHDPGEFALGNPAEGETPTNFWGLR